MVSVALSVGDLGVEDSAKGALDHHGWLFGQTLLRMHCQHCVHKDSLEKELIGFDWLAVVSHFCKTFENHITTNAFTLAEPCRVERVQHTHAVNAVLAIVGSRNVNVTLAYITDLNRALVWLWQQIIRLDQVLVVLGHQGMVVTVLATYLNLSFQENLLGVLLIFFDKLGFSLLGDCLSSDIVELIFSSQYSINWLSGFLC